MKSTYKKITLVVCLGAGLTGLGYMGLKNPSDSISTDFQSAADVAEKQLAQFETPTVEAVSAPAPAEISLLQAPHSLDSVKRLNVDTVANVEIFKSETPSIEIVGDSQELIDTIRTDYQGSNLTLSHQLTKPLKLKCGSTYVTMDMNGSNSTMVVNSGKQEKAKACAIIKIGVRVIPEILIRKSGSVQVTGADQQQLNLYIFGSGSITAEGKAKELLIAITGSGRVDSTQVVAKSVKILSQGSGDVTAVANGELQSLLKGSGDITVIGNPVSPQHVETGSGRYRLIGSASK